MRTLELNNSYDIFVDGHGNLAVQKNDLAAIRQGIVTKLSLISGEDIYDNQNGLNLDIMFGNNVTFSEKIAEIKRVLYLDTHVVSVDNIKMEADPRARVGYFTCYITVAVGNEEVNTTVGFGI